jgi:predicted RNA-binding Zn-ribbon protein involved in translation (DUF1610 family)
MASGSEGNCYLCGEKLSKTKMKNHILKKHNDSQGEEKCYLLKVEGVENKNYWLLIDIEVTDTLFELDLFLRSIWLECCGHMSAFHFSRYDEEDLEMDLELSSFSIGERLFHEYDFGTTTETMITIVGETTREIYGDSVRLLARNVPPEFSCSSCGKPATWICNECMYESENPFFCDECGEEHEHEDMLLSVTNSPRMGECAYEGDDSFDFDPTKI